MIFNKITYYNLNFWKKIIKRYAFLLMYKKIKIYRKIKRLKKLKWLMLRKNVNMIFTRRRNKIVKKKKTRKCLVLRNKQYRNILFKVDNKKKYVFTKISMEKRNKNNIVYNKYKKN